MQTANGTQDVEEQGEKQGVQRDTRKFIKRNQNLPFIKVKKYEFSRLRLHRGSQWTLVIKVDERKDLTAFVLTIAQIQH